MIAHVLFFEFGVVFQARKLNRPLLNIPLEISVASNAKHLLNLYGHTFSRKLCPDTSFTLCVCIFLL